MDSTLIGEEETILNGIVRNISSEKKAFEQELNTHSKMTRE
jgi:hypothetical protein